MSELDTLARVVEALRSGKAVDPVEGIVVGNQLHRFAAGQVTFEEAFDVDPQRGRSWRQGYATRVRGQLIADALKRFFHGAGGPGRMAQALAAYETRCWPRDQNLAECPPQYTGKPEQVFYELMKVGASVGERRIRQIGNETPF